MLSVFKKDTWRKARADNFDQARLCRQTLIERRGYAPDDTRLKEAVGYWVNRAKHAHAIVMDRRPVIENAVFINDGESYQGEIYAKDFKPNAALQKLIDLPVDYLSSALPSAKELADAVNPFKTADKTNGELILQILNNNLSLSDMGGR